MRSRRRTLKNLLELSETLVSDTADVYLLFADLVGSTEYKSSLILQGHPDILWILRQLIFLNRSAEIIKTYQGVVVKTIGDEIFAYFEATTDPISILNCGIEIIQSFGNIHTFKGASKIETKISIDFGLTYNGSINRSDFDPIGVPVDRCARLNSLAKKNEIIFSNDFLDAVKLKADLDIIKKKYGYESFNDELKGLGPVCYHRIVAH
jgi:class 3 adenylate cyclase